MSDDLREFIVAVCRNNGLQVPFFGDRASVVVFVWNTLEVAARHKTHPAHTANRQTSRGLLAHTNANGVGLIELLANRLKPLLSVGSTFRRSDDRYLLSACLLYGLYLKPRVPVAVLETLLPIYDAASFIKPADAAEAFWECARIVMFAILQCFLPDESDNRTGDEIDESLLEQLATGLYQSAGLADYFHWTPVGSDPMRLVLLFGYATLQRHNGGAARATEFKGKIEVCHKVGVFRALTQLMSDHIFIQNLSEGDQKLCTEVVCRLMTTFFDNESREISSSTHILQKNTVELVKEGVSDLRGDDYCSTFDCLAKVLEKCPDVLMQSPERDNKMREFLSNIPETRLLQQSAHLITSYIRVIRALATGEAGVETVFDMFVGSARSQFSASMDGYKYVSWDFILKSMMHLCDVLIKNAGKPTLGIRSDELMGFAAYMKLLGKIFRDCSPARIEERLHRLDSEFSPFLRNEKVRDMVLFIFCKPVPPELKAACAEALAGMGQAPAVAKHLLEKLRHVGLFATLSDDVRVHRYYLHAQLTSIEAPQGKYDCTIWTVRMVNTLLDHAEPLTERASTLEEVTRFCKDVLLDAIWKHLRYADPAQSWELSAVAFEHFLITLERLEKDTYPATSPEQPLPGQIVLHDILSYGLIFVAMRTCVVHYYTQRNAYQFPSNAANSAMLFLLELMLAVFAHERQLQISVRGHYRPFKQMLMADKEFLQKLLCTIDCALPAKVQITAVELVRQLFGSTTELMVTLDPDVQIAVMNGLNEVFSHGHEL